jgi:integrase
MALYKKKDSPFWWADVRVAGKRYRVSTKQKVEGKARTFESTLIQQLNSGSGLRGRAPYLRDFAKEFLAFVDKARLEVETKNYYRNGWKLLKDQKIAGMRIDATGDAAMVQVPGSGSNVNMALRTLKRMLSIAAEMSIISRSPRIRLAKERLRETLITPTQESLILKHATSNLRDVFLLIFDTGMRPGEACRLRWENVDFVRGVILITRGKSRNARRHLPMSARVTEMLKARAKKTTDWLFPSPHGDHLKASSIGDNFRALKRRLGFPESLVLYCARHTFATDFMGATGDLSKTQKTLGQGSITITTRYLHPGVADLGAIMDARNEERHVLGHGADTVH